MAEKKEVPAIGVQKQEVAPASTVLYNRAIAYMMQHYMDPALNRFTIADALQCSVRQLSKAFEGRSETLKSSLLLLRLHKGRALLRRYPKRPVADIARQLHFYDTKHFVRQYKKCFGHSPAAERREKVKSSLPSELENS